MDQRLRRFKRQDDAGLVEEDNNNQDNIQESIKDDELVKEKKTVAKKEKQNMFQIIKKFAKSIG